MSEDISNELNLYQFPSNYDLSPSSSNFTSRQDFNQTSPKSSSYIPVRSALSSNQRAFLRATGQSPITSSTKLKSDLPVCLGNSTNDFLINPRRKSVDVGGISRANSLRCLDDNQNHFEDRLGDLISDLFEKSRNVADSTKLHSRPSNNNRSHSKIDLITRLSSWSFQPLTLSDKDLFTCCCLVFEAALELPSLKYAKLSISNFMPFLISLRNSYHAPNAYHNYTHAIDVLQATYFFLTQLGVAPSVDILLDKHDWKRTHTSLATKLLSDWDVLALLIAAIGHDVGHPGLNNTFMNNAQTPLSEIYQSKSVLENMHCILLIQLLRKHNLGFLIGASPPPPISPFDALNKPFKPELSKYDNDQGPLRRASKQVEKQAEFMATATPNSPISPTSTTSTESTSTIKDNNLHNAKQFRNLTSKTVLATDMSLHFDFMKMLGELNERVKEIDIKDDVQNEQLDRTLLLQALIKCADISNPARPYHVCEHWSKALLEEWAKQASLEKQLDLPITVFSSADPASQAKSQVGFIDMFVQPLFETVSNLVPELKGILEHCKKNKDRWLSKTEKPVQSQSQSQSSSPSPLNMSRNLSISSQSGLQSQRSSICSTSAGPRQLPSCCVSNNATPLMSPDINKSLPIPIPRRSSSISTDDSSILLNTDSKIYQESRPSTTAPASNNNVTAFDPRFSQLFPLSLPPALAIEPRNQSSNNDSQTIRESNNRYNIYRISWPALPLSRRGSSQTPSNIAFNQ